MFTSPRKRGFDSGRRFKLFRCCELLVSLLQLCSTTVADTNSGTPDLKTEMGPFCITNSIYFVDYVPPRIRSFNPANNFYGGVDITVKDGPPIDQATFVIPIKDSSSLFAVGMGQRIGIFQWDGVTDKPIESKSVMQVVNTAGLALKAAATDTNGLLWVVSLMDKTQSGSLISVDSNGKASPPIDMPGLSYALAFSATQLYYTNDVTMAVTGYDYDSQAKTFSNNRTVFDMAANSLKGRPTGLTVDKDGNLWVACTNYILGIEPGGKLITQLDLPVKKADYVISSVVFGKPSLDVLYASSISRTPSGIDALAKIDQPTVPAVGVPGVPAALPIPP